MAKEVQSREASLAQTQRLYSILQRFGGSILGAQQLLNGAVITSPMDRRAIASMVDELTRIDLTYRTIASAVGNSRDDVSVPRLDGASKDAVQITCLKD